MAKQQSITSLPKSPRDDSRDRMRNYLIAMGIRVVCIAACFFVQEWWLLLPALGAVVLPYFAVVFANVGNNRAGEAVERPGFLVTVRDDGPPIRPVVPETDLPERDAPDGRGSGQGPRADERA